MLQLATSPELYLQPGQVRHQSHDGRMAERWSHVHILESGISQDGSWMVRFGVMKMCEIWGNLRATKGMKTLRKPRQLKWSVRPENPQG